MMLMGNQCCARKLEQAQPRTILVSQRNVRCDANIAVEKQTEYEEQAELNTEAVCPCI